MLYNENLHEEEQHLIQQIAEQTERGKIGWELTEYNPLSFLNEDKIDKNPAVICQSFSFEAIIGGSRFELDVMENIDVPSGMGDYTITLTRDETENYLKIEDALSFDCDRYECTPEEVAERFADSPIVRLCNATGVPIFNSFAVIFRLIRISFFLRINGSFFSLSAYRKELR